MLVLLIIIATSVQNNLAKGRIAVLSPLAAANGKVSVKTPVSQEQCSRRADAIIDFLLRTPRQWLATLFSVRTTPKIALSCWGIWLFIHPSSVVYPPIGISVGSTVFAGLTNVTNRQTTLLRL